MIDSENRYHNLCKSKNRDHKLLCKSKKNHDQQHPIAFFIRVFNLHHPHIIPALPFIIQFMPITH